MKQRNQEIKNDPSQALSAIKNVADNPSWFRDNHYYWAQASLPLAYAVACVEVVSKKSDKAGAIYQQIIEAWTKPGIKAVSDAIISEVPDSEMGKVKDALVHPENELLPDPNRPFKALEELLRMGDSVLIDDSNIEHQSPIDKKDLEETEALARLILEFIVIGFNRESDIKRGRFRVIPKEEVPWLIIAVVIRTGFESYNITLERLKRFYKVRKYKGKTIDFEKVLTEQPMSRWHRRIVASGKAAKLQLKNERIFMDAARTWYRCRVAYSSVSKFCDAQNILDQKNVEKQIKPCDEALGYRSRLPKKS
jgi:hypothetical protein